MSDPQTDVQTEVQSDVQPGHLTSDEASSNLQILSDPSFDGRAQLRRNISAQHRHHDGNDAQRKGEQFSSNAQLHPNLAPGGLAACPFY